MFGSNLERIKAEAMQELVADDDAALGQLWSRVSAAFDQWKQEHGNRRPKVSRGMLSDLVGAKSIPFKKAAPWQCADFKVPAGPIALAIKLLSEDYAPLNKITVEVGLRKLLALLIVGFGDDASQNELDDAIRILRAHADREIGWRDGLDRAREVTKKNLAKGPLFAAKDRTKKAAIENAPLIKDIWHELEKHPTWTAQRITDSLLKGGNPYGKTQKTILAKVQTEKKAYRKTKN